MPSKATNTDLRHMRRCLALARRAEGRTSPNPIVGAVVVGRDGKVLAEGWHRGPGQPHGEADALAKLAAAGKSARGATIYVSLEPCAHTSPRKPQACAKLLAASGAKRLVYGLADPFPGHGGGAAIVKRAGIRVDGPLAETAEECRRVNEPFVVYAAEQRAHFTLKAAMTLDGRIATAARESRWITGEEARADVHRLRNRMDAILVGVGTVAADDPLLNVRGVPRGRDPVRIVLDGRLRMSPAAKMLSGSGSGSGAGSGSASGSGSGSGTLVVTTEDAPAAAARRLEDAGAQIVRLPADEELPDAVDLRALARLLAERGLCRVLVEGGAEVHAAFLNVGLCDRLVLYVAPRAIGGPGAPSWLGGPVLAKLADAAQFRFDGKPRQLGDDLVFEAVPRR